MNIDTIHALSNIQATFKAQFMKNLMKGQLTGNHVYRQNREKCLSKKRND